MCTTSWNPALRVPGLVLAWLTGAMRSNSGGAEQLYRFARVPISLQAFLKAVRQRRSSFETLHAGGNSAGGEGHLCCHQGNVNLKYPPAGAEGHPLQAKASPRAGTCLSLKKRKRIAEFERGDARKEARLKEDAERTARLEALSKLRDESRKEAESLDKKLRSLRSKREEVSQAKSNLMAELKKVLRVGGGEGSVKLASPLSGQARDCTAMRCGLGSGLGASSSLQERSWCFGRECVGKG